MERERLEAHGYCVSADVRYLRKFDNVYLIDFLKLPLKSAENFEAALGVVTNSKLKEYCSQFLVLMPGDYPSQFHPRKIIFNLLRWLPRVLVKKCIVAVKTVSFPHLSL